MGDKGAIDLTDTILHLWRMSGRNIDNAFIFADSKRISRAQEEVFAPYAGSMDRFVLRISNNPSTDLLQLTFQVNGIVQRTIVTDNPGDVGVFLPANQLPLFFQKNDLLVIQVTGISVASFPIYEIDCDLHFIPQ